MVPESKQLLQPSYTKATKKVLVEYVKNYVKRNKSLDVLSIASNRCAICQTAPTWVPEVHSSHQSYELWRASSLDTDFRASGELEASVVFSGAADVMYARGFLVGEVSKVIGPFKSQQDIGNIHSPYTELLQIAQAIDGAAYEAFWRTLVLNRTKIPSWYDETGMIEVDMRKQSFVLFGKGPVPAGNDSISAGMAGMLWHTAVFQKAMDNATANRTFFLTKSGGTGIGPYGAQDGDLATVLLGSRRCIILRPQGPWYRVVGDAYVHGAMDGDYVKGGVAGARVFPLC